MRPSAAGAGRENRGDGGPLGSLAAVELPSVARREVVKAARRLGLDEYIAVARDRRDPQRAVSRRNERDDRHLAAILAAVLRADSNTVDVGANVGGVLSTVVRVAPQGRHVAFEPIPALADQLARDFPQVEVRAAAAAATRGTATFQWIEAVPALSGFRLRAGATHRSTPIEVRLERIDDIVAHEVAFLKIDVEGSEEAVLQGAQETLARCRPVVALEHGAPAAEVFGTTPAAVYDLLSAPGLRVFDMDGCGPFSREEFAEIVGVGERFNFIAC
jgi:FkbM family methyltransferase